MIEPYCMGTNCPLANNCMRYKRNIDMKKDQHLASVPYDHVKEKCGFYIGVDGENILNQEQIEKLFKKRGNGKSSGTL